jgi:hypothetical protein
LESSGFDLTSRQAYIPLAVSRLHSVKSTRVHHGYLAFCPNVREEK